MGKGEGGNDEAGQGVGGEEGGGEGEGHFNFPVTRWWNLIHGSPDTILIFHSNHFYHFYQF